MLNKPAIHPSRPRIAIIGGGVIGMAIGWRLAQGGARVAVFERDIAGHGASWAAAGMLAAGSEVEPGEGSLFTLLRRSQAMWPRFAEELSAASEVDVQLRTEGTLSVALTQDDLARLRQTHALQQRLGVDAQWLNRAETLELEPLLNPRLAGAVLVPGDHQVNNRLMVWALKVALTDAGGTLHEEIGDVALKLSPGGSVTGVEADDRFHPADIVVIAAGAWSRLVPGLPPSALPPVRPVKGQVAALGMDSAAPLLNHVIWAPKGYLVPRLDGRLIVGATTEEKGFDETITAGGMLSLLDAAWRVVPGVEELPIVETWVGFRPGSRDDAPILGETGVPGLMLATGHHRNGILLTPVTANAIATQILTGKADPAIDAFSLARFQKGLGGQESLQETERWISA